MFNKLFEKVVNFQEITEHSQAISSLVSASQIDTKKFGNTIRH